MRALAVIICAALAGCATKTETIYLPGETKVVDTACDWTKAIWISKQDVLTKETKDQIIGHNEAGAKRCGWKPKK